MATIERNGVTWHKCACCRRYRGKRHCRHCYRAYRTPDGLEAHERICYLNPQRECPVCHGKLLVGYRYHDGMAPEEEWCEACDLASVRLREREGALSALLDGPKVLSGLGNDVGLCEQMGLVERDRRAAFDDMPTGTITDKGRAALAAIQQALEAM